MFLAVIPKCLKTTCYKRFLFFNFSIKILPSVFKNCIAFILDTFLTLKINLASNNSKCFDEYYPLAIMSLLKNKILFKNVLLSLKKIL